MRLASYMKQDPVLPQVKTVFLENRNNNHLIEKSVGRAGKFDTAIAASAQSDGLDLNAKTPTASLRRLECACLGGSKWNSYYFRALSL